MSVTASMLPTGTNPAEREQLGTPLAEIEVYTSFENEQERKFLLVRYGIAYIKMEVDDQSRMALLRALLNDERASIPLPVEYFQHLELKSDTRCTYMKIDEDTFKPRRYMRP